MQTDISLIKYNSNMKYEITFEMDDSDKNLTFLSDIKRQLLDSGIVKNLDIGDIRD